ncbi:MAG: PAS domain S-box protein [Desulfobacteraceae bacterium]|nr:PAS domain S-box protein [Desulfobacteraceae bacterium]
MTNYLECKKWNKKITLAAEEKKFRTVIENIEDGYYEVDLAGNFVFFNQAMCDILGYAKDELAGVNNKAYMDTKNAEKVFQTFHRVYETGKGHKAFDWELIRKNGEIRHVDTSVALLTNAHGEPIGFHGIARDVSEQKNYEIRLQQSQKMEAIGTLAAGIAHDFNNILSAVFGYSQLAQNNLDNPQRAKEQIDQVIKSAQRAAELVQQVLTFSRQADSIKKPLRIHLIIKESLKLLRSSMPATIDIQTRLDSKQSVLADPAKIHQVVMNLCLNAYHAMKKEGGTLTVSLAEQTCDRKIPTRAKVIPPGDYLVLGVSDTGHGMDDKILAKAFDPYYSTREMGQGNGGLGLAIVQAIVDEHDGFLTVHSEPGRGARTMIYFPVAREVAHGAVTLQKNEASALNGTETIMVVDDEKAIREICREFLENHGYRVSLFENGMAALEAFTSDTHGFDLVVTDMTMPELTGDRLAREILDIRPDMPVILWCGFSEDISEAAALKMGIKKYMQKPIGNHDLLIAIRHILDEKQK